MAKEIETIVERLEARVMVQAPKGDADYLALRDAWDSGVEFAMWGRQWRVTDMDGGLSGVYFTLRLVT